jgi:hypothetical protein
MRHERKHHPLASSTTALSSGGRSPAARGRGHAGCRYGRRGAHGRKGPPSLLLSAAAPGPLPLALLSVRAPGGGGVRAAGRDAGPSPLPWAQSGRGAMALLIYCGGGGPLKTQKTQEGHLKASRQGHLKASCQLATAASHRRQLARFSQLASRFLQDAPPYSAAVRVHCICAGVSCCS